MKNFITILLTGFFLTSLDAQAAHHVLEPLADRFNMHAIAGGAGGGDGGDGPPPRNLRILNLLHPMEIPRNPYLDDFRENERAMARAINLFAAPPPIDYLQGLRALLAAPMPIPPAPILQFVIPQLVFAALPQFVIPLQQLQLIFVMPANLIVPAGLLQDGLDNTNPDPARGG